MGRDWDMENSFLCWWQQHLPFRGGAGDGIQRGVVSVVYGFLRSCLYNGSMSCEILSINSFSL